MKMIKVTNEIYTDHNSSYKSGKAWIPATPEPLYPNLYESIIHTLGFHFTFGQPYCVVCLKKQFPLPTKARER
jgi:hypothetical protein